MEQDSVSVQQVEAYLRRARWTLVSRSRYLACWVAHGARVNVWLDWAPVDVDLAIGRIAETECRHRSAVLADIAKEPVR